MKKFTAIFIVVFLIILSSSDCYEKKQMVLRTNWGVHFDNVGSTVSESSTSNYIHTVILPRPLFEYRKIQDLNCSQLNMDWYEGPCVLLNNMIQNSNKQHYETFSRMSHTIENAFLLIEKMNTTALKRRKKRNVWKKIGHFFQNLIFGSGSRDEFYRHEQEIAKAMQNSYKGIQAYEKSLGSLEILQNDRLSNMMHLVNNLHTKLGNISESFASAFKNFTDKENDVKQLLLKNRNVASFILNQIIPCFFSKNMYWNQMERASYDFEYAIKTVLHGEIPGNIISVKYIDKVIHFVRKHISSKLNFGHIKLINTNPSFYFKQKNILFRMYNKSLLIFIKFPLRDVGSLLNTYRVDTFPVPLTSGLDRVPGMSYDESYTLITDIPKYFLTTDNGEYYTTMSSTLFKSCSGENIKICKADVPLLQSSTSITCVFALFFGDAKQINSFCKKIRITHPLAGSAVQLSDNKGFLVHGANGENDTWKLACSGIEKTQKPCSMCRILPPCKCTFSTRDFEVTPRLSGCIKPTQIRLSYAYHPNLAMITSLHPNNMLAEISADQFKKDEKYPPLHIAKFPVIKFNWTSVVEKDADFKESFDKLTKLSMANITAYKSKIDKIAKKATDFSDVYLRHTSFIENLIQQFLNRFGSFGTIISFIFSTFGMAIIGLVLNVLICAPKFIHNCCRRKTR